MRPVRLEFCGINSFSEPAVIDFTDLLRFGIFGIFGDTGSGKSTILDCIGFALYGDVFRLGQRSSSIADIINYKLDRAYVNYEFEIVFEGKRRVFRAEREIKRKNAVQSARFYERREGSLAALADGVRECNALAERIIGLGQRDFEKCIALPQGEFAQFVKAARGDRLKLVSRLFDLEMYGEALTKRAGDRFRTAKSEADLWEARLEPYAGITQAEVKRRKEELCSLGEEKGKLAALRDAARLEEQRLTSLAERRAAAERERKLYRTLLEQSGAMAQLERDLSRLERAEEVAALAREKAGAERRLAEARGALARAQERYDAVLRAMNGLAAYDEEAADAEIERLAQSIVSALERDDRKRRRDAAERALERTAADYAAERKLFMDFSYETEREAIENKLLSLGEGDFYSFAAARGKEALFRNEYATFAAELVALTEKYPQIEPDAAPLAEKYARLSQGEEDDYTAVKRVYDDRERARAELQEQSRELEIYRGKYALHQQRLQQLQSDFLRLKAEAESYKAEEGEAASAEELRARSERKKREKREYSEKKRETQQAVSNAEIALAKAEENEKAAEETYRKESARFGAACERGGFSGADEARGLTEKYGDAEEARKKLGAYRKSLAAAEAHVKEYEKEDFSDAEGDAPERAKAAAREAEERERQLGETIAVRRTELERMERDLSAKREAEQQFAAKRQEAELAERLKKLLDGNKFMEFVAEECLQNVAENASVRLLTLTGGRYFLRYEGGFLVGDNFNGGSTRGVYTLSGGETFLVSLSLALSLSAEICAKSLRPIEFFFLDEGFGTLDEHLVDVVLDSLEKLKGEHFSIGIISHVEELKHRIDKKLLVKKATERHGSQLQAE